VRYSHPCRSRLLIQFFKTAAVLWSVIINLSLYLTVFPKFSNLLCVIIYIIFLIEVLIFFSMISINIIPLQPIWLPMLTLLACRVSTRGKTDIVYFDLNNVMTLFLILCFYINPAILDFPLAMSIGFIVTWPIEMTQMISFVPFLPILWTLVFGKVPVRTLAF
jgi:hypothetical protein